MKRYVELAPDHWGFETLANSYWQQKQPEKWKETLDESLKHEDFALSHARSRVAIARYFMERKQWAGALPYADAAAETGAAWAMSWLPGLLTSARPAAKNRALDRSGGLATPSWRGDGHSRK